MKVFRIERSLTRFQLAAKWKFIYHIRTMDQQYMQTSSQLYVFSTRWANRSAEAVMKDQFPSIISWHESQPETKQHLEVKFWLV